MEQGILGGYRANVKRHTKRGPTNINIKIERARRVGDKKRSSSSGEISKGRIPTEAKKSKPKSNHA